MIDGLEKLLEAQQFLQVALQPVLFQLKNTTRSLDERWDAFTQLVEANILVSVENYGDGRLGEAFDRNRVSLYDDFNMERGETMTYPDMWEFMEGKTDEVYNAPGAKDKWREAVLASGHSAFEYDW